MLNLTGKSMNFNGESVVDDSIALTMSANYNGDNVYFNKSIASVATYLAHKETADADYEAFETIVLHAIEAVFGSLKVENVADAEEVADVTDAQ